VIDFINDPGKKLMAKFTESKKVLAVATFIGTVVGVGIFAIPYAYSQNILVSIGILVISGMVLISLYTMYIDLILERGMGFHQLPGIVGKVFGKKAKNYAAAPLLIARIGILLLYITIFGEFSSLVLENVITVHIPVVIPATIIAFIGSLAIRKKITFFAKIGLPLSLSIVLILGITGILGFKEILIPSQPVFSINNLLLDLQLFVKNWQSNLRPLGTIYGVSIGALSGIAAIPSLKGLIADKKSLRSIVITGTIISGLLYAGFALFTMANSEQVSTEALRGLGNHWWVDILAIVGLTCTITSFLGIGRSLFEILTLDYSVSPATSWLITFITPTLLYLVGLRDFVQLAAIIGGLIGGIEGLLILACYWKEESDDRTLPVTKRLYITIIGVILSIGILLSI